MAVKGMLVHGRFACFRLLDLRHYHWMGEHVVRRLQWRGEQRSGGVLDPGNSAPAHDRYDVAKDKKANLEGF